MPIKLDIQACTLCNVYYEYEYVTLYMITTCEACTYHSKASPSSSQVFASARNSCPSRRNRSDVLSFLLVAFATRVDFCIGRAEGFCCLGGRTTPSNWTHG